MNQNPSFRSLVNLAGVVIALLCLVNATADDDASTDTLDTTQLILRVEFYDLPADEALRIQQEVAIQPDQITARDEIVDMVKEGKAEFVSSAPLVARPNKRAKYQDGETVTVISGFTWNEEAKQLVPEFETREVGTIFEVDPLISSDGETANLNFALEHHTGPPVTEILLVPIGDTENSKEVSVTRFQRKKITTQIFIKRGTVALIGAFEVTGPPEYASTTISDPKRLAFLCVDVIEIEQTPKGTSEKSPDAK